VELSRKTAGGPPLREDLAGCVNTPASRPDPLAQVRLEKYTADELLLHGTHPLGFKRYTVHARIYRVSMLHELGANVPIQSRCGASPATPRREIDCITGRLLAAEHSSRTLVPFHDSLGSHCPLRGS
jgi:hypothetical protein